MLDDVFPASVVAGQAVLISVSGKLRGRLARQLGERLVDLAEDGTTRVVLDMRELVSLDSVGTLALEEGLERGLRLHIVTRPGFQFDACFSSRPLAGRVRIHGSLERALDSVRRLMGSGLALV